MTTKLGASALALSLAAGLAALAPAASAATRHHHKPAPTPDPRDARISALEQEVSDLAGEVRSMRAAQAAAPPAYSAAPGYRQAMPPLGANGAIAAGPGTTSANNPPASSPDTPRPVTSSNASVPAGGATILAGKPSISSPDGRFVANLHGVMQFDAGGYFQSAAGPTATDLRRSGSGSGDAAHARDLNNGTTFRRARIGIDGKVFGDIEYNVLFDFGGAGSEDSGHIQELWLQYSGLKPFHFKIGAFRPTLGLEDQGSTNGMLFLERPAGVDTAASLSGGDYREGAQLYAYTDRWFAAGGVTSRLVGTTGATGAVVSGVTTTSAGGVATTTTTTTQVATGTAQTYDQALGFIGRAAFSPFYNDDWRTHIGVSGSYAESIADVGGPSATTATNLTRYTVQFRERPELRLDGTRLVDTGSIDAKHAYTAAAEGAVQWRNFLVQAEYQRFGIERRAAGVTDPNFSGFYVEGAWTLTGERRKFNTATYAFDAPPVDHPFSLKDGTWGAFEAALRYSDLDLNYHQGSAAQAIPIDGVRGGEQKIFAAGLNWYLNPIVRFMLDYQHVEIDRLAPTANFGATGTPLGAQVGQTYDTFAVRSQLAF